MHYIGCLLGENHESPPHFLILSRIRLLTRFGDGFGDFQHRKRGLHLVYWHRYDISGKVSTATACTILGPLDGEENDTPQPGFVNGEGFFGITNWLFDGKWDNTKSSGFVDTSALFGFTGGGSSGAFTYGGSASISDIMLVFKSGKDTNLVGYRVSKASGTYATPFTEPPFNFKGNKAKDASHISVYYREGGTPPQQIPEPGVLLLMGAGLMGLGLARRRKPA